VPFRPSGRGPSVNHDSTSDIGLKIRHKHPRMARMEKMGTELNSSCPVPLSGIPTNNDNTHSGRVKVYLHSLVSLVISFGIFDTF
jgi:hypothetical protein